ncbi:MAG: redoxin domain-containing protein [Phycisphaerae bacterium]|nr:redoxin domain-containing protein [Phycisphaerae bacterium]
MQRANVYRAFTAAMTAFIVSVAWADEKKTEDQDAARDEVRAQIGKAAPDFTLKDLDGKEHRLSDHKGKIVVLEWTNHQCPYVQFHHAKAHTMQKTAAAFKDKNVVWLAIDSSHFSKDRKEEIRKFAETSQYAFPILLDPDGHVGRTYQARTTPHMFVIDREGTLVYSGAIDSDSNVNAADRDPNKVKNHVAATLAALTEGKAVETTETKPYGCSVKYAKADDAQKYKEAKDQAP